MVRRVDGRHPRMPVVVLPTEIRTKQLENQKSSSGDIAGMATSTPRSLPDLGFSRAASSSPITREFTHNSAA